MGDQVITVLHELEGMSTLASDFGPFFFAREVHSFVLVHDRGADDVRLRSFTSNQPRLVETWQTPGQGNSCKAQAGPHLGRVKGAPLWHQAE